MSRTYRYDSRPASPLSSNDPSSSERIRRSHHTGHGDRSARGRSRAGADFRCGHCKLMVGAVPSGGRQRNHCPTCLYSRHVDGKTPGDRASDCGALMAPVATFARPNGEQVVVHRCGGCGFVRYNRVAADDNPLALMRLPLVPPPGSAAATSTTSARGGASG